LIIHIADNAGNRPPLCIPVRLDSTNAKPKSDQLETRLNSTIIFAASPPSSSYLLHVVGKKNGSTGDSLTQHRKQREIIAKAISIRICLDSTNARLIFLIHIADNDGNRRPLSIPIRLDSTNARPESDQLETRFNSKIIFALHHQRVVICSMVSDSRRIDRILD
jgi:hypothetical protein